MNILCLKCRAGHEIIRQQEGWPLTCPNCRSAEVLLIGPIIRRVLEDWADHGDPYRRVIGLNMRVATDEALVWLRRHGFCKEDKR